MMRLLFLSALVLQPFATTALAFSSRSQSTVVSKLITSQWTMMPEEPQPEVRTPTSDVFFRTQTVRWSRASYEEMVLTASTFLFRLIHDVKTQTQSHQGIQFGCQLLIPTTAKWMLLVAS